MFIKMMPQNVSNSDEIIKKKSTHINVELELKDNIINGLTPMKISTKTSKGIQTPQNTSTPSTHTATTTANGQIKKCLLCDFECRFKKSLVQHVKLQHTDNKKQKDRQTIVKHTEDGRQKDKQISVKHSEDEKHTDSFTTTATTTNDKIKKCLLCDFECRFKKSLAQHVKLQHTDNEKQKDRQTDVKHTEDGKQKDKQISVKHSEDEKHTDSFTTTTTTTTGKIKTCLLCDFECRFKKSLAQHVKLNHTEDKKQTDKQTYSKHTEDVKPKDKQISVNHSKDDNLSSLPSREKFNTATVLKTKKNTSAFLACSKCNFKTYKSVQVSIS